jgi:signal peptidase II
MIPFDYRHKRLLVIAGLILLADQVSKMMIVDAMPLFHSIEVIPGFFSLTHVKNPGGAFGFLAASGSNVRIFIFIFVSLAAVFFLLYIYMQTPQKYRALSIGFALVLGGALGNMTDRIRLGEVTDFFDFYVRNLHWPAFNVADAAITVGMSVVLFYFLFRKDIFE